MPLTRIQIDQAYQSYKAGYCFGAVGNVVLSRIDEPPNKQEFWEGFEDGRDDFYTRMKKAHVRLWSNREQ